jgi:hypothetical protein
VLFRSAGLEGEARDRALIEMEKRMRLHFDERLGDYLDVGFRLCERNEWSELHHCLCEREFQLLVMGLPSLDASFGRRRLVEFADSFVCPVALVGPDARSEITLNDPARLLASRIDLEWGEDTPAGSERRSTTDVIRAREVTGTAEPA